jgi:hypothetical protein
MVVFRRYIHVQIYIDLVIFCHEITLTMLYTSRCLSLFFIYECLYTCSPCADAHNCIYRFEFTLAILFSSNNVNSKIEHKMTTFFVIVTL